MQLPLFPTRCTWATTTFGHQRPDRTASRASKLQLVARLFEAFVDPGIELVELLRADQRTLPAQQQPHRGEPDAAGYLHYAG